MSLYCHAANLTYAQQTTELLSRSFYRKKKIEFTMNLTPLDLQLHFYFL